MHGENLLAADAVGNAADSDGFVDAAMLSGNDGAFKHLVALAGAFLDAQSDTHGVADVHLRKLRLHVVRGESFDEIHDDPSFT